MLSKLKIKIYSRRAALPADLRIDTTGLVQRESSASAMFVTGTIWARKRIPEMGVA
jgi:hypothetical protein